MSGVMVQPLTTGSVTKRVLSSTASKAYGSASCHGMDCELSTSASALANSATSLLCVSYTARCSGRGYIATFLLRSVDNLGRQRGVGKAEHVDECVVPDDWRTQRPHGIPDTDGTNAVNG